MAQLIGQPFDATLVDPTQGAGQLPIGKHPVMAVSSSIDATKAGDGGMLVYILKIVDGPFSGVTGPYRLNLYNNNPKAVEIAQKQLSALCHVTGVFQLADSDALLNIPFVIEVGPQKDDGNYTEVKKLYDINGNEPGKPPTNQAQPAGGQAGQFGGGQQQQQNNFQQQQPQQQFNQQQPQGQFGQQQQPQQQFGGQQFQQQQEQPQQQQQGNGQQWAPQNSGGQQQQPQPQQFQQQAPQGQFNQQQQQPQQQQAAGGAMPWGAKQ